MTEPRRLTLLSLLLLVGCGDRRPPSDGEAPAPGAGPAIPGGAAAAPAAAPPPAPTTPPPPLPPDTGAHTGAHRWSSRLGGVLADAGRCVALAADGDALVGGYLRGSVDLGAAGKLDAVEADGLVARLGPDGALRWARGFGGKGDDAVEAIAAAPDGGAIAGGAFSYGIELADGRLESKGADDIFVVALDAQGTRRWARSFGGRDVDALYGLATDAAGNVYGAGQIGDTVVLGTTTLVSAGGADIVVFKLSPTGAPLWARRFGGPGADYGRALRLAPDGDVVVLAEMSREVDFGTGRLESTGNRDAVVVRLAPDGATRWATRWGGSNDELALGLTVDPVGSVAVTGTFDDKLTFGADEVRSAGLADVFVAKLSPAGAPLWIRTFGGKEADIGAGLAADAAGNLYGVGWFWYQVDVGGTRLVSEGKKDAYAIALTPDGKTRWARRFGAAEHDFLQGIAVGPAGPVVVGTFHAATSFGGATLRPAAAAEAQLPFGDVIVVGLAP